MTINELLEKGITLQSVGLVYYTTEPDEKNPYGHDVELWSGEFEDWYSPQSWQFCKTRQIRYIYPLLRRGSIYPQLCIEVE